MTRWESLVKYDDEIRSAAEVLMPTPAVRNLIRESKSHQIYSVLQTGGAHGMQTMDASLAQLVRAGKITRQMAESRAHSV